MTIGGVVEKARQICVSGLFLLASMAGSVLAGDRDEIMAFIDRTAPNHGIWVDTEYVLNGLPDEVVFGRRVANRGAPFIESIEDIDMTRVFGEGRHGEGHMIGPSGPRARPLPSARTRAAIASLVRDGYFRAEWSQDAEFAEAHAQTIRTILAMDAGQLVIPGNAVLMAGNGFRYRVRPFGQEIAGEIRRRTDTAFLFNLGEFGAHRVIQLERDRQSSQCDWTAHVRVWLDEPGRVASAYLRVSGAEHLEFVNCYALGRDGVQWVYMTPRL